MSWVKSQLWFRYDLDVSTSDTNVLECVYSSNDTCKFDVLIDGKLLKTENVVGTKPGNFAKVGYEIPRDRISGKKRVAVMFRGREGKPTAELYELAVVRKQ
jgi:hypothetical protein